MDGLRDGVVVLGRRFGGKKQKNIVNPEIAHSKGLIVFHGFPHCQFINKYKIFFWGLKIFCLIGGCVIVGFHCTEKTRRKSDPMVTLDR